MAHEDCVTRTFPPITHLFHKALTHCGYSGDQPPLVETFSQGARTSLTI